MNLIHRAIKRITRRPPDVIIGGKDRPYMLRWWVIPRNPVFNLYLHYFMRSDDDRALHDHPWLFNASWLLQGNYVEHTAAGPTPRAEGARKFRWGNAPHRIELVNGPVWTLFATGPRIREWGFLCPQGFVHHTKFTDPNDRGAIGPGCDQ